MEADIQQKTQTVKPETEPKKTGNLLKPENFYKPGIPYGELCIFSLYKMETV